jgi:hypothetical protein
VSSDTRALFLFLLVAHAAHVGEEAWGRFWLIDAVFGMQAFLVLNAVGLLAACVLFLLDTRESRSWTWVAIVYAAFMALQGVGHNAAFLLTARYFGGFAGGVTGIALLAFGAPLAHQLYSGLPVRTRAA